MRWALGVELRRGRGWVVAVVAAGATVLAGSGGRLAGFWEWSATSGSLLVGLLLVAPLAAAAGAWWHGRDRRADVADHLDAHARPPAARKLARLGALGIWILVGQAIGMFAVAAVAATSATAGAPRLLPLAAGLLVPQTALVAGAALARTRLPSWAAAALAAAGTYVVALVGAGYGDPSPLITSAWLIVPAAHNIWLPVTVISPSSVGLVVATHLALLLLFGAIAVARRPVDRSTAATGGLGASGLVAVVAVVGVTSAPATWTSRSTADTTIAAYEDGRAPAALDDVGFVCDKARGVEVCVMAAWAPLLGDVVDPVSRTLAPVARATGEVVRAEQALYPIGRVPVRDDGTVTYQLPFGGEQVYLEELPSQAALAAVSGTCDDDSPASGDDVVESPGNSNSAQNTVAQRLVAGAGADWSFGFQRPDAPRAAPVDDALVAWLGDHLDELRACEVSSDELPEPEVGP